MDGLVDAEPFRGSNVGSLAAPVGATDSSRGSGFKFFPHCRVCFHRRVIQEIPVYLPLSAAVALCVPPWPGWAIAGSIAFLRPERPSHQPLAGCATKRRPQGPAPPASARAGLPAPFACFRGADLPKRSVCDSPSATSPSPTAPDRLRRSATGSINRAHAP
jgi:hypothetical protein